MPLVLNDSDGYLEVTIQRAEGVPVVQNLDLWESHNIYATLCNEFDPTEKPVELANAWRDYLVSKGLPPTLSHGSVFLLAKEISDAVEEFKKKHEFVSVIVDSPTSTDSTAPD